MPPAAHILSFLPPLTLPEDWLRSCLGRDLHMSFDFIASLAGATGRQRTWVMLSPLKSMYGSRDGHKASGSGEAKPVGLVTGGLVVSVLFIRQQEL